MNWETLMCFGDSITIGARTYMGYPEYAGDILESKLDKKWNVVNHATSGFTTIDLKRSISSSFLNLKEFRPSISTLLIGTNDAKVNTPVNDFSIAYNQILTKLNLLTTNKNILLIEIPHFTKGVMYPYNLEMNATIDKYNEEIHKLAAKYKIRTLRLEIKNNMFYDGVHLNNEGNKKFAEAVSSFILKDRGLD